MPNLLALAVAVLVSNYALDTPAPSANPSATATPAPILAGITLGEDANGVLRRFGLHPRGWSAGAPNGANSVGEFRIFPSHVGGATIGIVFDTNIHIVMVNGTSDPRSLFADPLGVRLGDTVERLIQIRGQADDAAANGDRRYGPASGVHWLFSVKADKITTLGFADGP